MCTDFFLTCRESYFPKLAFVNENEKIPIEKLQDPVPNMGQLSLECTLKDSITFNITFNIQAIYRKII